MLATINLNKMLARGKETRNVTISPENKNWVNSLGDVTNSTKLWEVLNLELSISACCTPDTLVFCKIAVHHNHTLESTLTYKDFFVGKPSISLLSLII